MLQRFQREARAASALNHPNICTIYGLEDADGRPAIVMELVEGETLSDRLRRGRLPLREAIRAGTLIASALSEAHRKGVVHCDLKPANIILTKASLKVLDFGLAKMAQPAAATDETTTLPGLVLGTPHYMSPEQAQGRETDTRTDIFSFGIVLYEMLAGKRPFDGQSTAGVMAAILEHDPPPFGDSIPTALDRVVRRCLAKNPDDRWQSACDLEAELDWIREAEQAPAAVAPQRRSWDRRWFAVIGLAALSAALAVALARRSAELPVVRFQIFPREGAPFGSTPVPAVSPDGKRILYATTWKQKHQIWLRSLDSPEPVPLLGAEGVLLASGPIAWSPDGKSIAFGGDGKLQRLDLDRPGGPGQPVTLLTAPNIAPGTWNRDGVILYCNFSAEDGQIYRIPDTGGSPRPVTHLDAARHETFHRYPWFLPDGRHFLYETLSPPLPWARKAIRVGSLDSTDSKVIFEGADSQATFAQGYIFFNKDDTLQAQPFNTRTLSTSGEAIGIANRVSFTATLSPFSVTENGPLVYKVESDSPRNELVWYDRNGNRLSAVTEARLPPAPQLHPQLSPDQKALAYASFDQKLSDIWVYDLSRGVPARVTFDPGGPLGPVWSPDGRSVTYASVRNGHFDLYRKAIGGSAEELLYSDGDDKYPTSWSADGQFLLFTRLSYMKPASVWVLPLAGNRGPSQPFSLPQTAAGERDGEFSPDGRWISYDSAESGRPEVYLVPFENARISSGSERQITRSGGDALRWRRDGKEVFYRKGRSLMVVAVTSNGHGLQFGDEHQIAGSLSILGYDVSADGQRFLLALRGRQISTEPLTVLQNWKAVLKK